LATQSLDKKRNGNLQTALIAPTIPEIRIPQDRSLTQDAERST
jgi:hypothetical protein